MLIQWRRNDIVHRGGIRWLHIDFLFIFLQVNSYHDSMDWWYIIRMHPLFMIIQSMLQVRCIKRRRECGTNNMNNGFIEKTHTLA